MKIVLPLLVLGLVRAQTQCGSVVCFHNASCEPGNIVYAGHPTDLNGNPLVVVPQTGVHCECTEGYTGVDCSIPVVTCNDGVHTCFHGGVCYTDDPTSPPYCDCSKAVDLADGSHFVGRFCEQKGPPASDTSAFCAAVDVHTFCLNGGECNNQFPGSGQNPCICGDAYTGAHCEYAAADNLPECTLQCQNGGVCRLGEESDPKGVQLHFDMPVDHMHCDCPTGFAGNLCEVSTSACDGIECLNGGTCVPAVNQATGQDTAYCQCPTEQNPNNVYYAGQFCQYESTDYCTFIDKPYFCTNGGSCNTNEPMAGCICDEGTDGFYCEYVQELDCDLQCINGSCKVGEPPEYSSDYEIWLDAGKHHDFQFCECEPGFSGKACEISADNACGDFACLNGGTCSVVESYGETQYSCNCLSAYVDEIPYDGKYCEFEATSICFDDVENHEIYFCMNNGQCQADYMQGCLCPEGFGGFSCEFLQDRDCTFDCQNGGECKLGSPPDQNYLTAYWFNAKEFDNWQYCDCPAGYSGEFCEAEIVDCGGYSCLNGGTCDYHGTDLKNRCNCVDASEFNLYYDGLYCQFPSTSVCKELPNEVYFCTNGGTCRENYLDGCDCPEGYGGFYCELLESVDCTLNCGDHGTCRLGAPPGGSHAHAYWYDPYAADDYQYCECDSGYGGKFCDAEGDDCGSFTCLNGGSCFDNHGKALADRCDCIHVDGQGPNGETIYYDGRFCQYGSTSTCFEGEFEGDEQVFFCMNGGSCNAPGEPCVCPDGFSGFSCEFITGTDCTLDCGDNGECRLGTPPGTSHAHSYWFSEDDQENYQYCECKNGYGGKFCDAQGDDCGDFVCLNGGQCTNQFGHSMVDRCFCEYASEDNGDGTKTYYDGRFCQYPSTSVCYESDIEVYFCMNGGTCSTNDPKNDPCGCPEGFEGHSCEFLAGTDCTLDCNGHGTCRLGSPPATSHAHEYWFSPYATWDYQYCECDSGYGGKHCEFAGVDCNGFTCLNGGKCDPSLPTRCDCLSAATYGEGAIPDTFYEGRFCQYESTAVCYQDDEESFFCTNDGRCQDNHLDGCDCPDGFTGFSCEFVEGSDCTLDCQNGGTCKIGVPPGTDYTQAYWYSANAQGDYQYCECLSGTDGQLCESDTVSCGDFTCLHQGRCETPAGRPLENKCNCIPSWDDEHYYDGLYCQLPSTSICYEGVIDGSNQAFFCMQDGTCQDDPTLGCICPSGTAGFSCEFKDPEDCTLDCKNGECVLGSPPHISVEDAYWFSEEKPDDYQYCRCDDGFTGALCDTAGGDKCGDDQCYNGGTCVTRSIDGVDVEHCDCRTAGADGKFFAGAYCQYESTAVCEVTQSTTYFCVNNGQCQPVYMEGCVCPANTKGFACEFVLDGSVATSSSGSAPATTIVDSPEDASCDLDCNGHGTCRNGIKDIDDLGVAINANQLSYTHDNFEHCVCERGWTGIFCDTEIVECRDIPGHFCLHGSTCQLDLASQGGKCDCSKATSQISDSFAGDHCEHIADICVRVDGTGSPHSYCANGGECRKYLDVEGAEHPGCICRDGFIGDKCQFTVDKSNAKSTSDGIFLKSGGDSLTGLGITAIILSILAACAIAWWYAKKCSRRRRFMGKSGGETSGLIWAQKGGFRDNSETVNFSPHKNGSAEDYMASFASPSRDPMATVLAPDTTDDTYSYSDSSHLNSPSSFQITDDEPQVFIGPPTDEDGHVLHSVDIL